MEKKIILAIIGTLLTAGLVVEVAYTVNNTNKKKSTNTITQDNTLVQNEVNEVINITNEVEEKQNVEPEESKKTEQKPKTTKLTSKVPSKNNTITEEIPEEQPEKEEKEPQEEVSKKFTINLEEILSDRFVEGKSIKIVLERDVLYDGIITEKIKTYSTVIKGKISKRLTIYIDGNREYIKTVYFNKEGDIVLNER